MMKRLYVLPALLALCLTLTLSVTVSRTAPQAAPRGGMAAPPDGAAAPHSLEPEPLFIPVKIDGPVHDPVHQSFWYGPFSECASVMDVDGDGLLDIVGGRNWYQAPNWTKHSDFRDGATYNGPETDGDAQFVMDVNGDGRMDIVSSGQMKMRGVFWYENPGQPGVKWKARRLHRAETTEGVIRGNLAGTGDDDILVNHWALFPGQGMTWLEHINKEPWFVEHVIGTEGERHGNGIGDINGDGRNDIVTPLGWYEAPPRPAEQDWTWHPDYRFEAGGASHPMLVYDVNGDGLSDIIVGSAHEYGLAWLEQKVEGGKRMFTHRWIERNFDAFHTMALGDLDGDGKPELITGRRLFPHHGRDIGEFNPLFLFWYKIREGGKFERHILFYNHLPWYPNQDNINPPPNYAIGTGYTINVADMDGDGRNDIVTAGKGGIYVFYNKGVLPAPRGKNLLPPESTYTTWEDWERPPYTALFNGKDLTGFQPATHWVVENSVIALKDRTDRQEHNDNYLWAKQPYSDFILELEFKIAPGTNSGIFLRTSDTKDPLQTGIEVEVGSSLPGRPLGRASVGALYDLVAPKSNPLKPNEWNLYKITCRGSKITVELNDELVSEADLDQWTEAHKNPDGTTNKFNKALKDFARTGYIGLQDHGTPVWYRKVMVRPLSEKR